MAARKKQWSQARIAKHVGAALGRSYSESAVGKWKNAQAPFVGAAGTIEQLVEWVRANGESARPQMTPKEAAELRDKIASAKMKELKLAILEGKLVDRDQIRRAVAKHITQARTLLETLHVAVALLIPDEKLREIVRKEVKETIESALRNLAKSKEAIETVDADPAD